jgi:hypothetical protein
MGNVLLGPYNYVNGPRAADNNDPLDMDSFTRLIMWIVLIGTIGVFMFEADKLGAFLFVFLGILLVLIAAMTLAAGYGKRDD